MLGEVTGIRKVGMNNAHGHKLWAVEVLVRRDELEALTALAIGDRVRVVPVVKSQTVDAHAAHCHSKRPATSGDRLNVSTWCCLRDNHSGDHSSCTHADTDSHNQGCYSWR